MKLYSDLETYNFPSLIALRANRRSIEETSIPKLERLANPILQTGDLLVSDYLNILLGNLSQPS